MTGPGGAGQEEAQRRGYVEPDQAEWHEADEEAADRLHLGIPRPGDVGRARARAMFGGSKRARAALRAHWAHQRR